MSYCFRAMMILRQEHQTSLIPPSIARTETPATGVLSFVPILDEVGYEEWERRKYNLVHTPLHNGYRWYLSPTDIRCTIIWSQFEAVTGEEGE